MTLEVGQAQVGDLLIGRGTRFHLRRGFNPWRRHVRSDVTGPRAWGHGSWSGAEWAAERVIPIPITVQGDEDDVSSWEQADFELAAAFAAVGDSDQDVQLRWNLDGREYFVVGRPRMHEPDPALLGLGRSITQCAFVALDPLIYDGTVSDPVEVGLPAFVGGLTVPMAVPVAVPSVAVGGEAEVENVGKAPVGLKFRIDGPVSEPRVTVVPPSGAASTLRFLFDLDVGQWVDVDAAARTVWFNGSQSSSRRGQVAGPWLALPQGGVSLVRFRSTDPSDGARLTLWPPFSAWW